MTFKFKVSIHHKLKREIPHYKSRIDSLLFLYSQKAWMESICRLMYLILVQYSWRTGEINSSCTRKEGFGYLHSLNLLFFTPSLYWFHTCAKICFVDSWIFFIAHGILHDRKTTKLLNFRFARHAMLFTSYILLFFYSNYEMLSTFDCHIWIKIWSFLRCSQRFNSQMLAVIISGVQFLLKT